MTPERYGQDPYIQLRSGDVLITKDCSIGKVALVESLPGPACLNSGVFVTRPIAKRYAPRFLYWVLCSSVFFGFIDYMSAATDLTSNMMMRASKRSVMPVRRGTDTT